MTRFARDRRVFFFEEPLFDAEQSEIKIRRDGNVFVTVPHLRPGLSHELVTSELRRLLRDFMSTHAIDHPVLWYYTPMALEFARDVPASAIVFDCMDELSAFRGAPRELLALEAELLGRADLVFTGGQSLFEAKRVRHPRVFAFPSSVDVKHFARARERTQADACDQAALPHPRIGFFGVIDERMDLSLLAGVASARPEWQLVILGPCVKIDPATLPTLPNIHYLGMKKYEELPTYLSGWDVAMLPFAKNESTRFISPTKTPEYLAAGCPVVSTSVRDVVRPYGEQKLIEIADSPEQFVRAIEKLLRPPSTDWRRRVDTFLSRMSWDRTWSDMSTVIDEVATRHAPFTHSGAGVAAPLIHPAAVGTRSETNV
jgi:glycosyltransferase involved in cell wall biosynthesis